MLATETQKKPEPSQAPLGANLLENGSTSFKVWAPLHLSLYIEVNGKKRFPMQKQGRGIFTALLEGLKAGDTYTYVLENGLKRADPVSRFLPNGLHGSTEIYDPSAFIWNDSDYAGVDLERAIFYELHVGTFTQEGSFEAIVSKLPHLKALGINCIELMPVCQCPGRWNWGYDGASLYAVEKNYGGPTGLKRLVNSCHQVGIGVCLDVVYNHLGPEGNYLGEFGPYFSDRYHTPWGRGFNYDGPQSDEVRALILQNIGYWIDEYHIDVLRLDAVHGIFDFSATHVLSDIADVVHAAQGKPVHVMAESDRNDASLVKSKKEGGAALDALWNDDFHHAAHVHLTNERHGYYSDFEGVEDLHKAIYQGFVYDGVYSLFRKKRQGNSPKGISLQKFIAFIQNHDQIGNRPNGERLNTLISKPLSEVAAVINLLTPSIPMLFMGQEYGETAPFEYFVDFEEEPLMRSIYEGRKREFKRPDMPFPGKNAYFRSHLSWNIDDQTLALYKKLIELRQTNLPRSNLTSEHFFVTSSKKHNWIAWEYPTQKGHWIAVLCSFSSKGLDVELPFNHVCGESVLFSTDSEAVSLDLNQKKISLSKASAVVLV